MIFGLRLLVVFDEVHEHTRLQPMLLYLSTCCFKIHCGEASLVQETVAQISPETSASTSQPELLLEENEHSSQSPAHVFLLCQDSDVCCEVDYLACDQSKTTQKIVTSTEAIALRRAAKKLDPQLPTRIYSRELFSFHFSCVCGLTVTWLTIIVHMDLAIYTE